MSVEGAVELEAGGAHRLLHPERSGAIVAHATHLVAHRLEERVKLVIRFRERGHPSRACAIKNELDIHVARLGFLHHLEGVGRPAHILVRFGVGEKHDGQFAHEVLYGVRECVRAGAARLAGSLSCVPT